MRSLVAIVCSVLALTGTQAGDRISYLDNGRIRLGVDRDLGGAIVWLSAPGTGNLVNNADWGRQIQLSLYSGPTPYQPNGRKPHPAWANWGWNPTQAGDAYRNRAVVESLVVTADAIQVTSIPMQWALDDVACNCRLTMRVTLDGPMARIHYELVNGRSDAGWYGPHDQELPAVYLVGALHRVVTYTGSRPFTQGPLTTVENDPTQTFPWARFIATEGWVAALSDKDWGVGISNPAVYTYLGGHNRDTPSWESTDASTVYLSPVSTEVIDPDITFEADALVRVGTLRELRQWFTATRRRTTALPSWRFATDRQHWVPKDVLDQGWPIEGRLVLFTQEDSRPRLEGPVRPFRADAAGTLRITGTWTGLRGTGHIAWEREGGGVEPAQTAPFTIPENGKESVIDVDLSALPQFKGLITRLTVWPADQPANGGQIALRSIEVMPRRDSARHNDSRTR